MPTPFHLHPYLARLNYTGGHAPTLANLSAITAAHASSIPFENIDVLLGRGISLEPADIGHKLVTQGRGGYCFEQNALLLMALQALGFEAEPLEARVCIGSPREHVAARTHLFVQVHIDGQAYLTDVGIGSNSLTAAIRWEDGLRQNTPHDQRRILRLDDGWMHQVRWSDEEEWNDLSKFTGAAMPQIDRDVANWYTSTHPNSKFTKTLGVSIATPEGGRRSINNREFSRRQLHSSPEKSAIASAQHLHTLLDTEFRLQLSQTEVEQIWALI